MRTRRRRRGNGRGAHGGGSVGVDRARGRRRRDVGDEDKWRTWRAPGRRRRRRAWQCPRQFQALVPRHKEEDVEAHLLENTGGLREDRR